MDILKPRQSFRFGALEWAVFAVYSSLLAWSIAHHVPWADEAQSWLLARDLSLPSLFGKYLHYEGTPGLWSLFLWCLIRLHVSYTLMHWIVGAVAAAGIWVFLRYCPFPLILRATLPFTFYLAYQYAVIARSYVAVPLCIFLAAVLLVNPARHLIALAIVLSLLANLCAQGFVLSAGLALIVAARLWQGRGKPLVSARAKNVVCAVGVLGVFWLAAIATAAPAHDNSYLPPAQFIRIPGLSPSHHPADSSTSTAQNQAVAPPAEKRGSFVSRLTARAKDVITYGLSNSWILSSFVVAVVVAFLISRRRILDLAPYVLLLGFFVAVINRPWHFGMAFLALVAILWINWPQGQTQGQRKWVAILTFAVLCVVIEQFFWTMRAIRAEAHGEYSGDGDAAVFLRSNLGGKKVAGFQFWSIGILPYFPSNIYFNQHKEGFWFWSSSAHVDDHALETLNSHPDYIVIGFAIDPKGIAMNAAPNATPQSVPEPLVEQQILATGLYKEDRRYCGNAFSGHGYSEQLCQAILVPGAQ